MVEDGDDAGRSGQMAQPPPPPEVVSPGSVALHEVSLDEPEELSAATADPAPFEDVALDGTVGGSEVVDDASLGSVAVHEVVTEPEPLDRFFKKRWRQRSVGVAPSASRSE